MVRKWSGNGPEIAQGLCEGWGGGVGGGRGVSAAGAALWDVVGRSCGRAAAAPRRAAAKRVGGGAQARAVVAVSSTSGRRILSCRYRGARPLAVAVAVLCFASLATGVQQF